MEITPAEKFEWFINTFGNATMLGDDHLSMVFNISNRDFDVDVRHKDCSSSSPVTGALAVEEKVQGLGDGFKIVNATFEIVSTEIENNEMVWAPSTDGGAIEFCVVLGLYLDTQRTILLYFLETVFKIGVDMTSGFEITTIDIIRTGPALK